jgi:hypothetical protein
MKEPCALDALLSAGGPVRVAVRPCCLAALVGRRPASPASPADGKVEPAEFVCAAAEAELQVSP